MSKRKVVPCEISRWFNGKVFEAIKIGELRFKKEVLLRRFQKEVKKIIKRIGKSIRKREMM